MLIFGDMRVKTPAMIRLLFGPLLTLLLLSYSTARANDAPNPQLRGPAFTDPNVKAPVPAKWLKQPIKHEAHYKDADLVITLDQQLYPALKSIIEKWAARKGVKIALRNGTCGISAGMLKDKTADIGGFCCPAGESDRLPGLRFHTLGIVPIVLITHPDNPVDNLSLAQAQRVFQGEIERWSEIVPEKSSATYVRPIQPVSRLHCKSRPGHWRLMLKNQDQFSPDLKEVSAIGDMISEVSKNKVSIGYEVLWQTLHYRDRGKVKVLKVDGHDPTDPQRLLENKYPLYRTYVITTWEGKGLDNPLANELVAYLMGQIEQLPADYGIASHTQLKKAGWKFKDDELIGEPSS